MLSKSVPRPHGITAGVLANGAAAAPTEFDPGPYHPHQRDNMPIDAHSVCHGGFHEVLGAWHSSEPSLCGTWPAFQAAAAPEAVDCVVVVEGVLVRLGCCRCWWCGGRLVVCCKFRMICWDARLAEPKLRPWLGAKLFRNMAW
eukprot:3711386-Amphidinium_carterae.1